MSLIVEITSKPGTTEFYIKVADSGIVCCIVRSYEEALETCEIMEWGIREYQMFHEYRDWTVAEIRQRIEDSRNDPLSQILREAITEEINHEIMRKIHDHGARENPPLTS